MLIVLFLTEIPVLAFVCALFVVLFIFCCFLEGRQRFLHRKLALTIVSRDSLPFAPHVIVYVYEPRLYI